MNDKQNRETIKAWIQDMIVSGNTGTAMVEAARWGDNETLEKLLEELPVDTYSQTGATALMTAATAGNLKALKLLISNGANVNLKATSSGATALNCCLAAMHCETVYLKCAKLLLDAGADTNIVESDGMSTRQWAEERKSQKLLDLLDSNQK